MRQITGSRADGLFEPDVVLPSQFFNGLRRHAPSKRGEWLLLLAVLEDAVHCYQKYSLARDKPGQRLFQEAEEWIMGTQPGSSEEPLALAFPYVCDVLGLDPAYLREGLQRWRTRQLAGRRPVPERSAA